MNTYKKMSKNMLFLCASMLMAVTGYSQPFQIRAVNKGMGTIGVEMRSTGATAPSTSDMVTDILFGIKWSAAYNVDLATTFSTLYNIRKSGARTPKGSFHYQAFYAESVPFSVPVNWVVNGWTEILSITNTKTGIGTGTFEIAETGFDPTTDPNIGINLSDYSPAVVSAATEVVLPVKLAKFEAIPEQKAIKIQWSTVNEHNSRGFEVQRTESNNYEFKKVGWVDSKAKSGSNNQYEFIDSDVTANVKYSYRINQVDYDGRSTFSPLKTALLNGINDPVIISPNPADKALIVTLNNHSQGEVVLQVIDSKGSVVQTRKEFAGPGKKLELNTSGLIRGQYFLVIQHKDGSVISRAFQKR